MIGADVPVSSGGLRVFPGGRDRRTDLRRQALSRDFGFVFGVSWYEAPEEISVSSAMRLQNLLSGRRRAKQDAKSGCPKKGRGRAANGSSDTGAASEATPELVSQDRKRVQRVSAQRTRVTNTGISFARRRGAWQQCRALSCWGPRASCRAVRFPLGRPEIQAIIRPSNRRGAASPRPKGPKSISRVEHH